MGGPRWAKSPLVLVHFPFGIIGHAPSFQATAKERLAEWIINFNNKLNGFAFVPRKILPGEGFLKRLLG